MLRLQPDEGVKQWIMIKDPGPGGMRLRHVPLDMSFAEAFKRAQPGRLRAAAPRRDPRQPDAVHAPRRGRGRVALDRPDPRGLGALAATPPKPYTAGTWGPSAAIALIERDGRTWHDDEA